MQLGQRLEWVFLHSLEIPPQLWQIAVYSDFILLLSTTISNVCLNLIHRSNIVVEANVNILIKVNLVYI